MAGADEAIGDLERLAERAGDGALKEVITKLQDANDALRRKLIDAESRLPERSREDPLHILAVGDPHSDPAWDNRRFSWLGKAIVDLDPDVVVCLGDFATLGSLGKYDRGKLTGEGQRLTNDIAACRDALSLIEAEARGHRARRWMLLGNHEDRISRYTNDRPELAGTYSDASLGFEEFGWLTVPFLQELLLAGIRFVHYMPNDAGHAVTSKYLGANILAKRMESVVVGHSHRFSYHLEHAAKRFGLSVGWFSDHPELYATPFSNENWWSGLVSIRDARGGYGTIDQHPMEELRRRYG